MKEKILFEEKKNGSKHKRRLIILSSIDIIITVLFVLSLDSVDIIWHGWNLLIFLPLLLIFGLITIIVGIIYFKTRKFDY